MVAPRAATATVRAVPRARVRERVQQQLVLDHTQTTQLTHDSSARRDRILYPITLCNPTLGRLVLFSRDGALGWC